MVDLPNLCGRGCGFFGSVENRNMCSKCYNKCKDCNKKVGVTGFSCRCGNVYCSRHRLPEEHACTYDFKAAARENLKLVRICADKLDKIL
ncbi:zinc finger A20 and AN1 domain-containing stress-associated protein 1-like [Humulus lupulus]|uniref:zinc finger A20 and AN1 domain-containing stress-associated protein 1-like n=1 Tax=Humulus lupulus TaxID=3486 RepID=UPI002B40A5AA|nr:zinc finger A20 and AN1 domain-containing stress-associated protein 1-like [Humulus lupulus]